MASMDAMMKACMKPHAIAHLVTGAGVGILVLALIPSLAANALVIGIIVVVAGVAYDFMVNKG
ncbi:hypothetical protein HYZ70_02565 [Candidatus Curtissbacteria bacterium]|nr:hypothetical protein [Candidatus Curtissbacteria bacterium]